MYSDAPQPTKAFPAHSLIDDVQESVEKLRNALYATAGGQYNPPAAADRVISMRTLNDPKETLAKYLTLLKEVDLYEGVSLRSGRYSMERAALIEFYDAYQKLGIGRASAMRGH